MSKVTVREGVTVEKENTDFGVQTTASVKGASVVVEHEDGQKRPSVSFSYAFEDRMVELVLDIRANQVYPRIVVTKNLTPDIYWELQGELSTAYHLSSFVNRYLLEETKEEEL